MEASGSGSNGNSNRSTSGDPPSIGAVGPADESSHLKNNGRKPSPKGGSWLSCCKPGHSQVMFLLLCSAVSFPTSPFSLSILTGGVLNIKLLPAKFREKERGSYLLRRMDVAVRGLPTYREVYSPAW